jgi:hypothetical protein
MGARIVEQDLMCEVTCDWSGRDTLHDRTNALPED